MDELIGSWSVDALYAPGPSDEVVYFMESGKGWVEYLNWGLSAIETFKWWRNEEGNLNIQGEILYSIDEPPTKSDTHFLNLQLSLSNGLDTMNNEVVILNIENGRLFFSQKYGKLDLAVDTIDFEKRLKLLEKKTD